MDVVDRYGLLELRASAKYMRSKPQIGPREGKGHIVRLLKAAAYHDASW